MEAASRSTSLDEAHGRAPRQTRSRRTMARIVAAAEALFAESGYDGASVHDIVARAGCSIGAFYARFTDKESLFLHLHEHHCRLMIENVDQLVEELAGADADLATTVRRMIDAQYRFAETRRAITRVFIQRSGEDADFHARYARAWGDVAARLRALLLTRRDRISRADPALAADFVIQMLHASWANDVLHHGREEITGLLSAARQKRELAAACLAYLCSGPARSAV